MTIISSTATNRIANRSPLSSIAPSDVGQRPESMVQLLQQRTQRWGDDPAFTFIGEDGSEQTITFAELDLRARAIAASLSDRVDPGDRALLVFPAGLDFISAFFGCLYAGVVATPATYPKPRRPLPRMSRIAEDSGAKVVLTTGQTLRAIDFDQQDAVARRLEWFPADEAQPAPDEWEPVDAKPDDLAFLQYTSGSTSEPKGVMVTHGNLLANLEAIRGAFGLSHRTTTEDAQCGVFWLPAYHDMGLIGGVLTPLYVGGPSVLMAPTSFLQRPLLWLETISKRRATISGAPNFAYDLCVERTTEEDRSQLNLESWRLAFCGAEPISATTLDHFADAFEPAGFHAASFYPCYGLAEATLLAAGPEHNQSPTLLSVDREALRQHEVRVVAGDTNSQVLVGCGTAPHNHQLEIVCTQTGAACEDGQVGEIYVQGPSVAAGYWNRSEETAETFGILLPNKSGVYLRTGDLGFRMQGELFVTGRVKDVIILRGRNHYPQDIEQTAEQSHPAVQGGAAFSIEVDGEERLVVVHQLDRACRGEERDAVCEAIRRAVLVEHELDAEVIVLIRQMSLPVTSSGKVQRSLCREQFLAGELKILHEWRRPSTTADDVPPAPILDGLSLADASEKIVQWMRLWLQAKADIAVDTIDPQQPFADLGLDSLTAVELSSDLERTFRVPLPPVVAWNYPTPAAMGDYLAKETLGIETPQNVEAHQDADLLATVQATASEEELASLLDDIEGLSDEEARRLLAEE